MIIPQKFAARLAEKHEFNSRFLGMRFELEQPAKIVNEAGQYVMIEVAPSVQRAYSMCDRPDVDSSFELLLDTMPNGVGVNFLRGLDFGARVNVLGPLGQLTIKDDDAEHIFLLASGSGVSPFKAILADQLQIKHSEKQFTLLWSMRTDSDFFWLEDILAWQEAFPNFTFIPLVDNPTPTWVLATGFMQDILKNIDLPEKSHFYLCGNPVMIANTREYLASCGFTPERITTEQFFADTSSNHS